MRCTVQGARTSKGRFKQLKSSLRSRRKLRLVWPGNGQRSDRVRSPWWRLTGRKRQESRLHIPKNWTIAGADMRLGSPAPRTLFPREALLQGGNPRALSRHLPWRYDRLVERQNGEIWYFFPLSRPAAAAGLRDCETRSLVALLFLGLAVPALADFTVIVDAGRLRLNAATPMAQGSVLVLVAAGGDGTFSNSLAPGQ